MPHKIDLSTITHIIIRDKNGQIVSGIKNPSRHEEGKPKGTGRPIASAKQWASWVCHAATADRDNKPHRVPTGGCLEGYVDKQVVIRVRWDAIDGNEEKRSTVTVVDRVFEE